MEVEKNIALSDQHQAFLADFKRYEQERKSLMRRRMLWGEGEHDRAARLDLEIQYLLEQAGKQGIDLSSPKAKKKEGVKPGKPKTLAIALLVASLAVMTLLMLYLIVGVLVLHLLAACVFFAVGIWLGKEFTVRSALSLQHQQSEIVERRRRHAERNDQPPHW